MLYRKLRAEVHGNGLGLGNGVAYLGGFEVLPQYRGRGIYTAMLETICRDISGKIAMAYAEAAIDNLASREGLEKAGFRAVGMVRTVVFAGFLVKARLIAWTS